MLDQIKLMKSNRHYRIGDVLLRQGFRWQEDRKQILKQKRYKDSLLFTYLSGLKDPLFDPFKNRNNTLPRGIEDIFWFLSLIEDFSFPTENNTLYVHLRAGDIVLNEKNQVSSIDSWGIKKNNWLYNQQALIKEILKKRKSKISIVSSFHFGDFFEKKLWTFTEEAFYENQILFLNLFNHILQIQKFDIYPSQKNDIKNIDEHFILLCNARNVILDNGSFGSLVNLVRQVPKSHIPQLEPTPTPEENVQELPKKQNPEDEELEIKAKIEDLNLRIETCRKLGDEDSAVFLENKLSELETKFPNIL